MNDLELENQPVRVTTRTTGSILLGMDIIQRWDCHIGKDNKDKTSLIACPQDAPEKIWNDYCEELETRFSIRRM